MILDNPIVTGSLNVQNAVTASNISIAATASAVYFTGSFVGDGTQLTGVTSYTDGDTLDYINSLGVLSGSAQIASEISGAFASVSESIAQDIANISTDFDDITNKPTLISSSAQIASDISGSFTDLSSSLEGRVTAQESFSSSLSTTELILSGSFSGSFIGDGSQLSGVTSYTDADTLAFINSKAVLSGSIAELTAVTASFLNTGSVTIPHSFNSKNVSVAVYDDSDILIIPQEIALISNNAVKITFGGSTSGFAVVAKGGHIVSGSVPVPQLSTVTDSFTSATTHTVTHNFNTKEVIVSVYEGDTYIIPDTITTDDLNNVTVTFPEAVTGRVVVVKAGHIVSGSIPFDNLLSSPFEQGTLAVTSSKHIVPSQDQTYDLGSPTLRFRDVYISSASIFLGNTVLSEDSVVTTASLAAVLPDNVVSSSAQIASDISGSFTELSSSLEQRVSANEGSVSSLNSASSSYLLNTTDTLTGDLTVTGKITAQEFHTEFVSASIIYQSGSTKFGNSADDRHEFTGSVFVSNGITGTLTGNASTATSASYAATGPFLSSYTETDTLASVTGRGASTSVDISIANGQPKLRLKETDSTNVDKELLVSGGDFYIRNLNDNDTAGTNLLLVDSSGHLSATGRGQFAGAIRITETGTAQNILIGNQDSSGANTPAMIQGVNGALRFGRGNSWSGEGGTFTEVFKVESNGIVYFNNNVGIGTTSPQQKLTIDGTSSGAYIRINNAASGDISSGFMIYNGNNLDTQIYTNPTFGNTTLLSRESWAIRAGGSQRMAILSNGNVGINETSPSYKLEVSGDMRVTSNVRLGTSLDTNVTIGQAQNNQPTSSDTKLILSGKNLESEGVYYGDYGQILFNATSNYTGSARKWLLTNALDSYKFSIVMGDSGQVTPIIGAFGGVSGGTPVLTITDGANVGIQNTTPNAPFDVQKGVRMGRGWHLTDRAGIRLDSNGTSAPADILFGHTAAGNESSWTGVYWSLSSRGSSDGNKFHIYRGGGNPTAPSESIIVTVDPNSKVGINKSAPDKTLDVDGTFRCTSESDIAKINFETGNYHGIRFRDDANANKFKWGHAKPLNNFYLYDYTKNDAIFQVTGNSDMFFNPGGNVGIKDTTPSYTLDVNGTIRATGDVIAYSDARVKENVKTIDNALDKVKQLRGVSYNKISETEEKIGVSAQEIEKILPQVVQEDDNGMKSVAYGNIVGVLIEAIKELSNKVEDLENKLNGTK